MADATLGQHRVSLLVHRGEHLGRDRRVDDAHLGIDVGARQDRDHSRDLPRCARIDALEDGVGVGTPDESQLQRAFEAYVVDVGVAAGDELGIFEPLDPAAHELDRHGVSLPDGSDGVRAGGHGTTRRESPASRFRLRYAGRAPGSCRGGSRFRRRPEGHEVVSDGTCASSAWWAGRTSSATSFS